MFHCSAAEGQRFQNEIIRITDIIKKLGRNPIKDALSPQKKERELTKKKTE